ncbi:hypothetical protein EMCRGX_G019023 [Ephydatia muelleri]
MGDRNEILANFQAVTGIEEIETCIHILDHHNWDLTSAVNTVFPQERPCYSVSRQETAEGNRSSTEPVGQIIVGGTSERPFTSGFHHADVSSYIDLTGGDGGGVGVVDRGAESNGTMVETTATGSRLTGSSGEGEGALFLILKSRPESWAGIPVSQQQWSRWPPGKRITDDLTLGELGSGATRLELEVTRFGEGVGGADHTLLNKPPQPASKKKARSEPDPDVEEVMEEVVVVSSEEDEFFDADDFLTSEDTPISTATAAMKAPLIPQDCIEPTEALMYFTEVFKKRYGPCHPSFYVGSLADVVREALDCPIRNRKPLFIYIHHDASILANIFSSVLLCSESVVSYLTANYLTWAWDVTCSKHRDQLIGMVRASFGNTAATSVDDVKPDHLPLVLIVCKQKGGYNVYNILHGDTDLDTLMMTLIGGVDSHQAQLEIDAREEQERLARERMIEEQDRAFKESLEADRKKKEQQDLEEARQKGKEDTIQHMGQQVPPEPLASSSEKLSLLKIRFPDGTTLSRRFLATHTLEALVNLVGSKGYLISEYKLLSGYPRRDVSGLNYKMTLEEDCHAAKGSYSVNNDKLDYCAGYTVYDHSLPTFPPTTTSAGDINNLNPNGVYQFSVVAQMTITGQLYSGEMDTSLVNTPTITPGQSITWNGQVFRNNSLVSLSAVQPRVTATTSFAQAPLVCQEITGGQWYDPSGVLFPLATPDPVSTPGGLGQRNVSGGVELYRGTPSVFPHGVQCCTNTTITLCVGMYSDLTLANAINLAIQNGYSYALSVAATYGPNITGGVQFQLLTPTIVDPPVFQLTCTSTSSPPTDVLWTTNGGPVSNTSSQIVTDRPTSTYNNTLTVTGRAYRMYTCTVTTTCSPVCGGFTFNPRSTTSSLTVQAPPGPPTGVTAVQSGPTSVSVSWTASTSGGPVTRYDIYYVANGGPSTSGGSTNSTSYVLTNLEVGVQYNISVIAVGTSLPSLSANVILTLSEFPSTPSLTIAQVTSTSITAMWSQPGGEIGTTYILSYTYQGPCAGAGGGGSVSVGNATQYTITGLQEFSAYTLTITASIGVGSSPPASVLVNTSSAAPGPGLQDFNKTFTTITLTWQPPPVPNGVIIMYQVTYSTNGVVNTHNRTTPPVIITGLVPRTTYIFSVTAYTITGPGTPQQVQTSTADIPHVTGVVVSAINTTSVRVFWLAVQLPPDGILTGYTVYYFSLLNTSKRQSGGYTNHTFPPTTTWGDINNLNPNGVYQFSVVAQVTIMGQLYSGEMDTSLVNTPTITPGQSIPLNGQVFRNNSLVTLSVVLQRVNSTNTDLYPLVCQGITGGQWYEPNGVLFPLATPDPVSTPGGLGQRNVSGGVELYRGTPSVFPHGVQCCTNTTITLCVGMYTDLTLANATNLATSNGYNYGLSVAATYGPNITGGVQFQLLTPTNVDPPVFQLTCTSTSSPPTDVLWTTDGSPVSNTFSQILTDRPTSTYNNILTVTGRAYGMYSCTVTTTCSPVCGGFTFNPRSTTSSLTVEAPPGPPSGVTAVQSGPTSVSVSWTAPTSGGPVTRYDIYYVANGGPSTSGGSTNSTSYDLTNLQVGVQYNISAIAVGTSLPSLSANVRLTLSKVPLVTILQSNDIHVTLKFPQTWYPLHTGEECLLDHL